MKTFVFASNNSHKLAEVRPILAPHTVLSLSDIGCAIDIEENGTTLEANSQIKAQAIMEWMRRYSPDQLGTIEGVFADDTGLEIDALGGQPGVYTARWAGEAHNDALNRRKALSELQGITNRQAQFRTVITLISSKQTLQVEGVVRGRIATEEYGNNGFGYDPIFIPEGYDKTFAELPASVKNSISHRARALEALKKRLL